MCAFSSALKIALVLDSCFPDPKSDLDFTDPFSLLVALILSAQCRDERVNQVTPALLQQAPTPVALAASDPQEIEQLIRKCGLAKRKASYLTRMAQELLERHSGVVPKNFQDLEALSGIGHKSASVLLAQCFGLPAFAVDTHILRNAKRWGLSLKKSVKGVEEDLKALFPKKDWSRIHLQMVLFSRRYCPARHGPIALCPICSSLSSREDFEEPD